MSTAASRNSLDQKSILRVILATLDATGASAPCNSTIGPGTYVTGAGLQTTVAAATLQSSVGSTSGTTTYLSGFAVSGTVASAIGANILVTGGVGTTQFFKFGANAPVIVSFNPPLPAAAAGAAIVVTVDSVASGNAMALAAWGSRL